MRTSLTMLTLLATTSIVAAEPVKVVASFSILADMTRQVGGDAVEVTSLVGPGEDTHVYEPVPSDVVAVGAADVVVLNGLGFEGFMDRLVEASDTEAMLVVATNGIDVIEFDDHDDHGHDDHDDHGHDDHDDHGHDDHDDHGHDDHDGHGHDDHDDHGHDDHDDHGHHDHDHGPNDPHAWHSLDAAAIYVANIASGLCEAAPDHCEEFIANAEAYTEELEALEGEWNERISAVPVEDRVIITSHDAFAYLGEDYDLTLLAPQGQSTESEASAADVAAIIDQINDTGAKALFVEVTTDPRVLEQIADETGLEITGTLYTGALDETGPASTYLGMMRANMETIVSALSGS